MAPRDRERRGAGSPEGQSGESEGHPLSGLHSDPRIASYLAGRLVQRRRSGAPAKEEAPQALERAGESAGKPLPEKIQKKFGASLGADLGSVRVHTGVEAAAAAESVGARAYTVGKDIHFGAGEYDPERPAGEELLAHEVAHTVQQGGQASRQHKLEVGSSEDPAEHDADQAAARMVEGAPARVSPVAPAVHRKVDPAVAQEAKELKAEMQEALKGAHWKEKGGLREKLYPQESAKNKDAAKERKAGTKPDLTGLGQIKTVEHFVSVIKGLQPEWGKKSHDDKLEAIKKAINSELTGAEVPVLTDVLTHTKQAKGFFDHQNWRYLVSQDLIKGHKLSDADAEELCNVTMHEARHAEQQFLAARYAAGPEKMKADDIAATEDIPPDIAAQAADKKFDDKTDPAVLEKGKEMYGSMVANKEGNDQIERDMLQLVDVDLPAARKDATHAMKALDQPNAERIAKAREALDVLNTVVEDIEKEYPEYRAIAHEADAHDVGDSAALAFEGAL